MTDWRLKIYAYLHDPPDKPLALGRGDGHEAWGFELARRLAGDAPGDEWERWKKLIQRADHLAAGADRSGLLPRRPPALDELRHPLSGQPIDLSEVRPRDPELADRAREALDEEFKALERLKDSPEAAFLALWGLLPLRLRSRRGPAELRGLWDLLPAETRMPNHPVAAHAALVSALATVLAEGDDAVLLSFSLGPVQRFIAQARRASDLWAGSALLSRAALRATLPVVEQLGPDHIVFPVLRRSRLFLDEWLLPGESGDACCAHGGRLQQLLPEGWKRERAVSGGLPNRFLAVVPAARAEALARQCEERARQWWEQFVAAQAEWVAGFAPELDGFAAMAREQARGHMRVAWAASPWPLEERVQVGSGATATVAWLLGGELPPPTRTYLEAARAAEGAKEKGSPQDAARVAVFSPNGGTLYGTCYETAERLLGAVKLTRIQLPREEDGLKCTLCGERGVVPTPLAFEVQKEAWARLRQGLRDRGLVRRGEALCGVCWAKRRFGRSQKDVPSTSEIAATPFKRRVLENLNVVAAEVRALCDAVAGDEGLSRAYVVPALLGYEDRGELHGRFLRVAGEALLASPREDRETDVDEEPPTEVVHAARDLRRAAKERARIDSPRPYLAVLVLDGDGMGKWLSGAKNLPLRHYLTSSAITDLEEAMKAEVVPYLKEEGPRWPMTPALHAAVSEACGVFSQGTAPRTLHNDGLPALLIYAGGDDVLALTPIGCHDPALPMELATEAALRLRLRFSGHVRRDGHRGDIADPASEAGYVLDPRDGLGMAFGRRATASAGLAVFHHKWPLGRALEEARKAEERAKDELGRDALAISILRRSGQVTHTGLRFGIGPGGSAVKAFQRLCHAFAFGTLSPRFVTEVRLRLAHLHGGLPGDQLMDLARPVIREAAAGHFGGGERILALELGGESEAQFQELVRAIGELGAAAGRDGPEEPDGEGPSVGGAAPPDLVRLARWLDLIEAAAFLGRGEEP